METKIKNNQTNSIRNKSLSTKIAGVTSLTLVLIFVILIFSASFFVSKVIKNTLSDEFKTTSKLNGQQIQEILNKSATASKNLNYYITETSSKKNSYSNEQVYPSKVCKSTISQLNYDIEQFSLGTVQSTLSNSDEILGMGIAFEPYVFDSDEESYSLYLTDKEISSKSIKSLGSYAEYSKNDYYIHAIETKEPYVTSPFVYDGVNMITVSYPIIYNGKACGIVCCDISIDTFTKIETKNDKYPSLYSTIFTSNGTVVYQTENSDNIGKNVKDILDSASSEKILSGFKSEKTFSITTKRANGELFNRFFYPLKAGNDTWWAQTAISTKEMNQDVTKTTFLLITLCVLALAIVVVTVTVILKKTLKPIEEVVTAAENISSGNLNIYLEAKSNDEIGKLAVAFNTTAQSIKAIISDINYQLGEMANGNFDISSNAEDSYVGDFNQILISIKNINTNLSNTLSQINQASSQVNIGAEQVSSAAQALSQGAVEQASSIEELSATISEISDHVKLNAQNAQNASKNSNDAVAVVKESNVQMTSMISAMNEITDKSNEISKIIKTIEDIAFQTNILALNAAVEAARAGAAGKGFAVVADEVRNLATKSAEAAQNTTDLIEQTVSAVANGSQIANETAKSLEAVVANTNNITILIDEIANASEDQSTSITQVTLGVEQISGVVQNNSATAEESAAASEELNSQADMLKTLVNQFKISQNCNNYNEDLNPSINSQY